MNIVYTIASTKLQSTTTIAIVTLDTRSIIKTRASFRSIPARCREKKGEKRRKKTARVYYNVSRCRMNLRRWAKMIEQFA